jgi:hypothetical protein
VQAELVAQLVATQVQMVAIAYFLVLLQQVAAGARVEIIIMDRQVAQVVELQD